MSKRTTKENPLTPAERTAKYDALMKAQGLVRRWVWAKPEHVDYLRDLADVLAENPKILKDVKKLLADH